MDGLKLRELKKNETGLLEEFIYHAIYRKEGSPPLPRTIIRDPSIALYYNDFGKPGDHCLVAEYNGKIVGAAWARILNGEPKGFGNLDGETPELAISLLPGYRGKGIGTLLMSAMLRLLKERGYARASLSVQKGNYAVSMYKKAGFVIVGTTNEEFIMAVPLR